jgi:para-aminobenzoate synthetase / 4-amino-4-deoxychorismate lyase
VTPARALRIALDVTPSVAQALRCLRDDERPFALAGAWCGGEAVLGSAPVAVLSESDDPFAALDRVPAITGEPGDGFVGGGWVGYLGYEMGRRVDSYPPGPPRPLALPDAALAYYDHVLRRDGDGRWWFEALVSPEREAAVAARLEQLRRRLAAPPAARAASVGDWAWTPSPAGHAGAVAACVERIAAGDLYQANLTLRLDGRLHGDALDLFCTVAEALPTDRAAFVSGPWGALVSLSPELFLARHGRCVRSAPIKGTRPEGERAALESSAKDRAENVMIVDLVRNDLGRVCRPGTVRVAALADVRPHAGVWHMVSEVVGELRDGVGDGELVRAAFPPGSVTGAPKVAAMAVIAELESTGREAYTGAIGIASPASGLELSVAIRTLEVSGDRVWLGVGGGIVADSDPVAEGREAADKAAPILAAAGGAVPPAPRVRASAPAIVRTGPQPVPRPDPRRGVFDTALVADGAVVDLDGHVARLRASVRELYGGDVPDAIVDRARGLAAQIGGRGIVRLSATPDADRLDYDVQVGPLGEMRAPPPRLHAVVVPGGIGAHKWSDRGLLDALEARFAPALALLVDVDGLLLETTRTNIFVARGGRLLTPPLDGRILPGVTRARILRDNPVAAEHPLDLDDLATADAIYVTSALRGLQALGR